MAKRKQKQAGRPPSHHKKKHHGFFGLGEYAAAKHSSLPETAIETGKDLLIGVVGGGLAGAAIGKSSLLAGILVTGAGHFIQNRYVQLIGIGMMASNGFQSSGASTTNGLEGIDGIKDRLMAYKDSFSQKFYLDKFLHKKVAATTTATTSGFGDVQYFTYPNAMNGGLAALDDIENQLAESALEFQGISGALPDMSDDLAQMAGDQLDRSGDLPDMAGDLPDNAIGDLEDKLY